MGAKASGAPVGNPQCAQSRDVYQGGTGGAYGAPHADPEDAREPAGDRGRLIRAGDGPVASGPGFALDVSRVGDPKLHPWGGERIADKNYTPSL